MSDETAEFPPPMEKCRKCGHELGFHLAAHNEDQAKRLANLQEAEFGVPTTGIYCPPLAD